MVNFGGQAQSAHRDYHPGFMPLETAADYPEHVHRLSPLLTLHGALAHCDMPVETGPTMYLPNSQKYVPGYVAADVPEFVEYFARNYVQLPLATRAGERRTDRGDHRPLPNPGGPQRIRCVDDRDRQCDSRSGKDTRFRPTSVWISRSAA